MLPETRLDIGHAMNQRKFTCKVLKNSDAKGTMIVWVYTYL